MEEKERGSPDPPFEVAIKQGEGSRLLWLVQKLNLIPLVTDNPGNGAISLIKEE